ncbi:MAG: glycosyl hydrolase family 28-related protein [Candidatus Cybelea sp.]
MGNLTVINVIKDHGAKGDGKTDDTSAIQSALNDSTLAGNLPYTQTGGIVYFPRGTYLISQNLLRQYSNTQCVGEGKNATTIKIDVAGWKGNASPTEPTLSFMFDLASYSVKDCLISDLTIDGSAGQIQATMNAGSWSGILCSQRSIIERVSIYDVWGFGLWVFGDSASFTRIIDCDADLGLGVVGGKDCIGGGAKRTSLVRFHWMSGLQKNTAMDMTTSGTEASVSLYDCANESVKDVVLEGVSQSVIHGCRFYGCNLHLSNDAGYGHGTITNPADITVSNCIFAPWEGDNVRPAAPGGGLQVSFDGGDHQMTSMPKFTNLGGRIAVLGNSFYECNDSAIKWTGDDNSTSSGGSVISNNRIYDPNSNGTEAAVIIEGAFGDIAKLYSCGIAVAESAGLSILNNTINDDRTTQLMQYSMQLQSADGVGLDGKSERIVVTGNLCGTQDNQGNGSVATFFPVNWVPQTTLNPNPKLLKNLNQPNGLDSAAAFTNGQDWPPGGGYPYDALILISGGSGVIVNIQGDNTGRTDGAFYLPVGQKINIRWTSQPTINVFPM